MCVTCVHDTQHLGCLSKQTFTMISMSYPSHWLTGMAAAAAALLYHIKPKCFSIYMYMYMYIQVNLDMTDHCTTDFCT